MESFTPCGADAEPVLDRIGRAAVRRRDFGKASGKDNNKKKTEKAVRREERVLLRDI